MQYRKTEDQRLALPGPFTYSKRKKRNKDEALGDHLKQGDSLGIHCLAPVRYSLQRPGWGAGGCCLSSSRGCTGSYATLTILSFQWAQQEPWAALLGILCGKALGGGDGDRGKAEKEGRKEGISQVRSTNLYA